MEFFEENIFTSKWDNGIFNEVYYKYLLSNREGDMMRNMKKWMGIVVAGVMCVAMGMTAVAAPSPSTQGIVQEITSATDKNGNSVEVVIEELTPEGKEVAKQLESLDTVKELVGDAFVEGMKVLDVQEVTVKGDSSLVEWPVTLTFKVPGVVETTKVAVLHYDMEKKVWESVPCKAGKGTIEATFESLSPVAFVVDQNTMDATVSNGSATSPQTGESAAVMGFALVALLAAGGAWALSSKKRA